MRVSCTIQDGAAKSAPISGRDARYMSIAKGPTPSTAARERRKERGGPAGAGVTSEVLRVAVMAELAFLLSLPARRVALDEDIA